MKQKLAVFAVLVIVLTSIYFLYKNNFESPVNNPETADCRTSGCSGHLCIEAGAEQGITTCEWIDEYSCYDNAECKRQANGKCGWTQTEDLKSCLREKNNFLKNE